MEFFSSANTATCPGQAICLSRKLSPVTGRIHRAIKANGKGESLNFNFFRHHGTITKMNQKHLTESIFQSLCRWQKIRNVSKGGKFHTDSIFGLVDGDTLCQELPTESYHCFLSDLQKQKEKCIQKSLLRDISSTPYPWFWNAELREPQPSTCLVFTEEEEPRTGKERDLPTMTCNVGGKWNLVPKVLDSHFRVFFISVLPTRPCYFPLSFNPPRDHWKIGIFPVQMIVHSVFFCTSSFNLFSLLL